MNDHGIWRYNPANFSESVRKLIPSYVAGDAADDSSTLSKNTLHHGQEEYVIGHAVLQTMVVLESVCIAACPLWDAWGRASMIATASSWTDEAFSITLMMWHPLQSWCLQCGLQDMTYASVK